MQAYGQVWNDTILPRIQSHVQPATAHAIDIAAEKIFSTNSTGLIVFASLMTLWYVSGSVRGVMSATVLDFCDARFPAGPVDLELRAFMSSIEIIVPPGLALETHGSAILGSFEAVDRAPAHPDPEAPLLRVHGSAVMGSVEIRTRLPGESEWQARARQRRELREAKRTARRLER